MNKKKILSILMIGLIVLGTVLFVVKSLRADCSTDFANCSDWCLSHNTSQSAFEACNNVCLARFAACLEN